MGKDRLEDAVESAKASAREKVALTPAGSATLACCCVPVYTGAPLRLREKRAAGGSGAAHSAQATRTVPPSPLLALMLQLGAASRGACNRSQGPATPQNARPLQSMPQSSPLRMSAGAVGKRTRGSSTRARMLWWMCTLKRLRVSTERMRALAARVR